MADYPAPEVSTGNRPGEGTSRKKHQITTMADTLPTHYTTEFSTNWIHRVQQSKGRLDAFVEDHTITGERKRFDRIGSQSSHLRTERKGPTQNTDPSYDFRWANNRDYELSNLLDKDDARKLGELVLPTSDIVKTHAMAYHRDADDVAWGAALGSVLTGELGTTVTTLPSSQQIAAGGTGLTIAKLRSANYILQDADLEDEAPRVLVVTAQQILNLLATTEVTSADYNSVKALVDGKVDTFMGFKFKIIRRLTKVSTTRSCVAWVKGAIKRTKGVMMNRIDIRTDLSMATQIYSSWHLGATRVYDEGVVQIDCIESATP